MAENKKSFIMYCDWQETFESLTDEEAGKLIKHFYRYVNDENPVSDNRLIAIVFEPMKAVLKNDLKKYEDKRLKNKENIGKRWNKKNTTEYDRIKYDTNYTVNDNDNDNDNVNERENIIPSPEIQKFIDGNSEKELKDVFIEISKDQRWIETICMNFQLKTKDKALDYLEQFMKKLLNEGTDRKSIKDTKSHFARWLTIQIYEKPTKSA